MPSRRSSFSAPPVSLNANGVFGCQHRSGEEYSNLHVYIHFGGYILGGFVLIFRLLLTLVVQTYDYVCSFHQELAFLTQSRWTKVKGLYILTRYTPFLLFVAHLYLNFIPDNNPDKCQMINNICSCFSLISVICSECFFIIRTYALWNHNKVVLAAMLAGFLAVIVASVGILFSATANAPFETSVISSITGCYQSTGSDELFVPFVLLFALELGLISLTLVRAIQSWRTARTPLYDVLLKHNIFYYVCGLFFSMVNVFTCLFLRYAYNAMFQDFQLIILAILATRMHLHLWHVDRQMHSSALMLIPLTDVSSVGRTG